MASEHIDRGEFPIFHLKHVDSTTKISDKDILSFFVILHSRQPGINSMLRHNRSAKGVEENHSFVSPARHKQLSLQIETDWSDSASMNCRMRSKTNNILIYVSTKQTARCSLKLHTVEIFRDGIILSSKPTAWNRTRIEPLSRPIKSLLRECSKERAVGADGRSCEMLGQYCPFSLRSQQTTRLLCKNGGIQREPYLSSDMLITHPFAGW